jgi:branched-chain amino acid transport system substrate-binding protein
MNRWTVLAAAIVTGAFLAVTAAWARPSADTIDIGWVGDKSGPTASSQVPTLHGIESYIKYVNSKGGVGGKKINLIEADDTYNVAKTIAAVKSQITEDKVPAIMGISNSSAFSSLLPLFNQNKVIGMPTQSSGKLATYPFQPYIFPTTCSYSDQAWVGAGYALKRLGLKSFKNVTVGIAAIQVTSGQEWIDSVTAAVKEYGATDIVVEPLAPALVSADVQVQDMQRKGVKVVFIIHAIGGGIAWYRSASKFNFTVPTITNNGLAQDLIFTSSPYDAVKDSVGASCFDPPYLAKTPAGKLLTTVGKQQGVSSEDLRQANYTDGWVSAQILVQGLRNANGNYTSAGIKKGLEKIKNLDSGLSPIVTLAPKCHIAFKTLRPYTYNFKKKGLQQVGTWAQWQKYNPLAYAAPGTCGVARGTK